MNEKNNNKTTKEKDINLNKLIVRKYALLAAYSYPKRRDTNVSRRYKYFYRDTRKVNMKAKILKDYSIISDLSNDSYTTLINDKDSEIVMSIRGTDLTKLQDGDLITDAYLVFGYEKSRKHYKDCYANLKNIIKMYKKYKIVLVGASLGGRLCINLLDSDLGNKIDIVHVYNAATSLSHLYQGADCLKEKIPKNKTKLCRNRLKLYIHVVNKDPIGILSLGDKSKTRRVYKRKYNSSKRLFQGKNTKIHTNHSIMNFV